MINLFYFLTVNFTFLVTLLKNLSPANVMVAVCLPFLVNFLRLNVALPLAFVLAVYFLPLTLRITLALDIALPDLDFKVMLYFLDFLSLKVFFLAVILTASLVTLIVAVLVDALYALSPAKLIFAFREPVFEAFRVKVAIPLSLVDAFKVWPLKTTLISLPEITLALTSLRVIW